MLLAAAAAAPALTSLLGVASAQQQAQQQAEQQAQLPEDSGLIIRTPVTNVLAPTTVLDRDGNYRTGLKAQDFRLYDNNELQVIKVDETFAPISVVIAVQADYQVDAVLPRIRKLGSMLSNMVAGETGELAVLSFDHRIQNLTNGFTTNADKVNEALTKLKAGSMNSALTDAVVTATRMLRNRHKENRKVLILVAESLDKGSTMKTREALTNLEMSNVMVYALNISRLYTAFNTKPAYSRPDPIPPGARHVPGGGPNTPGETARNLGAAGYGADFAPVIQEIYRGVKGIFIPNPIEVFTKYTGGHEYPFVTQADLEKALAKVSSELHNQYLLTYSPSNKSEGGYHRIRVEVLRNGLGVTTRPGYWMASVQ